MAATVRAGKSRSIHSPLRRRLAVHPMIRGKERKRHRIRAGLRNGCAMNRKTRARRNIPWNTVSEEDWARGCAHVAGLKGVTPAAAAAARKRLGILPRPAPHPRRPVPEGLRPTDSPAAVVRKYGVSLPTAKKWLASVGRTPAAPGRPPHARFQADQP